MGPVLPILQMLGLAFLGSVGPGEDPNLPTPRTLTEEVARQSHSRMLAALRKARAETSIQNPYLGDAAAIEAREAVAALGPNSRPFKRWRALRMLGHQELRLGNSEEAVKAHQGACELLERLSGRMPPEVARLARFDLAVAQLRLGEQQNCVARHTSKSCILPIEEGGVHVEQEASRAAIRIFEELLEEEPGDLKSRWLVNIAYMTIGEYPKGVPERWRIPPETFASDADHAPFVDIAPERGLNTNSMSGGVIVDDFNGDDVLDIVVSDWALDSQIRFFAGSGKGEFTDRTEEAGLLGIPGGLNMMQADYDNDGHTDILVLRGAWLRDQGKHPNSLLKNLGGARFLDVTFAAGLARENHPTQTAGWADYDNDGDLDLYVGNEKLESSGGPGQLFRNNGDGTFEDVARESGVANDRFAKGVTWGDYDGDRLPDLYVSNQNDRNRLFRNEGDGTFVDVAPKLGLVEPIASFPTWFWDYDNDGALDLLVLSYEPELTPSVASYLGLEHSSEFTHLYRGQGDGSFAEIGREVGLDRICPTMGCNFGDLDSDGFLDFYLGTGFPAYDGLIPNLMYRNVGGTRFANVTTSAGFGHVQKGHAVAFADLDDDGDQDVFIELGGAYPGDAFGNALFDNPGNGNHWIEIQLVGTQSNRSGIGARIRCTLEEESGERSVYRHVNSGGSFGASPLRQTVGLGENEIIQELEIYWPTSDTSQVFQDVPADQKIRIIEGQSEYQARR